MRGRTLEVGCSWGYVTAYVGGDAGLDLNPDNIQIAQQLNRAATFTVGNALALPYPDREFLTVMLPDVLEHIEFDMSNKAIMEACRVSRGRVLVTVPKGDEDTDDAQNMKHAWLATRERVERLFPGQSVTEIDGFYCISLRWQERDHVSSTPN